MAPTDPVANYSLFSIPAYWMLALVPHAYSTALLKPTTKPKSDSKPQRKVLYNLANPRSSQNAATYSNAVSPDVYARWERARAAHSNMLENSGFFVSAILAGVFTRCDPSYMNRMAGMYLFTRTAYLASYISVKRGRLAFLRTVWFFLGYVCLISIWWQAGKKVMAGDY